jgi:hypothetical protein
MIGKWIVMHPIDLLIAVVLAVVAAFLIEIFKFLWRDVRNLISPTTIKEIDRQINEQLEMRRILTNEKAFYLSMFRDVFGVLALLCITASTFITSFLADTPASAYALRLAANGMLIIVALLCGVSMKRTFMDSRIDWLHAWQRLTTK